MIAREIQALLGLALRGEDEGVTEIVTEADLKLLAEMGVVDAAGSVTDKGRAYIAAIEGVPLPVLRWVLPENYGKDHKVVETERDVTDNHPQQPKRSTKRGNRP